MQDALRKCAMNDSCYGIFPPMETDDGEIRVIGILGRDAFSETLYETSEEGLCFYEPLESTRNKASKLDYNKAGFSEDTLETECDACDVQNQQKTPEGYVKCSQSKEGFSVDMDIVVVNKKFATLEEVAEMCNGLKGCSIINESEDVWSLVVHHTNNILFVEPPRTREAVESKHCSFLKKLSQPQPQPKPPSHPPPHTPADEGWSRDKILFVVLMCIAAAILLGFLVIFLRGKPSESPV